ncbi:MAG: hypothetical protein KBT45_09745, partial [Bacteroidales bacterium]|nr:hypothetical protein [Candidatus Colimorpha pelethequi]
MAPLSKATGFLHNRETEANMKKMPVAFSTAKPSERFFISLLLVQKRNEAKRKHTGCRKFAKILTFKTKA